MEEEQEEKQTMIDGAMLVATEAMSTMIGEG